MIGLLQKFSNSLPRQALITIYKAFVRPHLDYGDVVYDQALNNLFHAKMESIQFNPCLAITGPIRGTSKEKIYKELDLESLKIDHRCRRIYLFCKAFKNEHPKYLFNSAILFSQILSSILVSGDLVILFFCTQKLYLPLPQT